MELYIEKEFLEDLFIETDIENPTPAQNILIKIFREYGEVNKIVDFEISSAQELSELKRENLFFAYLCEYFPPFGVKDLKAHLFEKSNFEQTLIFCHQTKDWFEHAEINGALCFSIENYQDRIKQILECINIKIDLTHGFEGWELFLPLNQIPMNEILFVDGYIFSGNTEIKINNNIIPLLKNLMPEKSGSKVSICTKVFPVQPLTIDKVTEFVKKAYLKLNSVFSDRKVKFKIISIDEALQFPRKFHDRMLISNFYKIECGLGFSLIPYHPNNSQITVDSIFDKFTYDRIKSLMKVHKEYDHHLKNLESLIFKSYP